MAGGFFDLGEMIAGGGIDREGARLEGLDAGSRIQARRATTVNALAQARLRVDEQEANIGLADAIDEIGLPRELSVAIRAGVDPKQITGALLEQQEFGNRANLADLAVSPEQRLQSAQAVNVPDDPFQFGGGGDLFADVFNPGAAPELSATGPASIDADVALAEQRRASAALSDERRLHPDRFKALPRGGAASDVPLSEQILGGDEGISIIPDNFVGEEGFGAESFIKGGANAFTDFIGAGVHFPDQARAQTVLKELASATKIVMRADVPGGRIPIVVQEMLNVYAEDPQQLFRGDELARENLRSTVVSLKRSLQRVKDQLDSPTAKTPTRAGRLENALFKLSDLVADYEKVLQSIQNTEGDSDLGSAATSGLTGATAIGDVIQLDGGGTATRIE